MSWGVYTDIFVKKDGKWSNVAFGKNTDFLKNLCEYRERLSDDIIPIDAPKDLIEYAHSFDTEKEEYATFVKKVRIPTEEDKLVLPKEEIKKYSNDEPDIKEYLATPEEERNKKYVELYYKVKISHFDDNGNFYNIGSFASVRDKLEREYKDILKKKFKYEELKSSLDYLKLSDEEKENVNSEYDYLDEELEETEYKLNAAISIISILDFFDDYKTDEVVAYIAADC